MFKKTFLLLIRFYQLVFSPDQGFFSFWQTGACRFYPSCSTFTYEAVVKYGALKGLGKGIKRILRCHPWHKGGYDPVP